MVLHVKLSDDEIVEKIRSVVGSGAEANNGEPDPARKTTKDVIHEVWAQMLWFSLCFFLILTLVYRS